MGKQLASDERLLTTIDARQQMNPKSDENSSPGKPMRLIRLAEVKRRTGVSTSTIYRWMSEGKFPRSHPIGDCISAWTEAEIDGWIESKVNGRQ